MQGRKDIAVKQSIPKHLRYTVEDFNREFPNDDACLEHIAEERFPGGRAPCEKCGVERKHYRVSGRTAYACDHCGNHIYPLAGTIFEKTTTSLRLWFYAMYLMGSTRCGISAKQIQRETGVTYKTAWRMFREIRTLLSEDLRLDGPTEMDETYFGGRIRSHQRKERSHDNKTAIIGMVERKGRAVAKTAISAGARTLHRLAKEHILPSNTVYTDEATGYDKLASLTDDAGKNLHSSKIYVMGDIHTNTVEGFWSLIKRGIGGVYHAVSQKYLQTYLDEYTFRYNRRDQGNLLFKSILAEVSKRASKSRASVGSEIPRE